MALLQRVIVRRAAALLQTRAIQTTGGPPRPDKVPAEGWLQFVLNSSPLSFATPEADFTSSNLPAASALDENQDVVLSREELVQGVQRLGLSLSASEAGVLFDDLDLKQQGQLPSQYFYRHATEHHTRREMLRSFSFESGLDGWHSGSEEEAEVDSVTSVFSSMDLNQDGVLSREELIEGSRRLGLKLSASEAGALFDDLDSDKDGVLSPEEFYRHAWDAHASQAVLNSFSFETSLHGWQPTGDDTEYLKAVVELERPDAEAQVITEGAPPFNIVAVNPAWEALCGFSEKEALGQTLNILQGPGTDQRTVSHIRESLRRGEAVDTTLTNYNKQGAEFINSLSIRPIRLQGGHVSHFLGVLRAQEEPESGHYLKQQEAVTVAAK